MRDGYRFEQVIKIFFVFKTVDLFSFFNLWFTVFVLHASIQKIPWSVVETQENMENYCIRCNTYLNFTYTIKQCGYNIRYKTIISMADF